MKLVACAAALVAAACFSAPAVAHVTFERAEATVGAPYRGVLRVPHGCNGQATHAIRVSLPEEIVSAKPMPKAGWSVSTTSAPYAKAVDNHGRTETGGVREIVWSGGKLEDGHYDEFTFVARISPHATAGLIHARVMQECDGAKIGWVEIPATGAARPANPAPAIRLVAAAAAQTPAEASYRVGALVVTAPWTRATPKGAPVAGGYVRITNTGAEVDRLVGGSFEGARRVEVHEMVMDGSVMRMRELRAGLEIAPGQTVELRPGGLHLMFMELKGPVVTGAPVRGRLTFEKAGSVEVQFAVAPLGATTQGGSGGHGGHDSHGGHGGHGGHRH